MNKLLLFAGIGVVILVVSGYIFLGGSEPVSNGPVGVFTFETTVQKGSLNLVVSSNGVVDPINKVEIKSKASGQIEELRFIEGQEVSKGEQLLKLDQRTTKNDVDQARADLKVAQANLQQQQNNMSRINGLFEKSLVSEQERDQANLEFVRAQAQLVKAQAALSSSEERLADTRIVAPISGVILTKNVELGQIISSGVSNVSGGTLLATIADMNEVYVLTNVDEVDIGKVKVGQRATVIADAYPDDRFTGEVVRIAPQGKTTQSVTTFTVVVQVRNRGGRLKAGMTTSVDIEIFNQSNVLLVTNEALRDPRSQQGKELLEQYGLTIPVDSSRQAEQERRPASFGGGGGFGGGQNPNMSEDERNRMREQMRQRFASMSPEERQQMMQRFGGGQGGPGARRRPAETEQQEARWRIVMAKEGAGFTGRLIKVGHSNFDQSVVLDGLSEGDVVQVTTVSRAKIAQEEFNARMRERSSMGGMSSGGGRR